MLKIREVVKKKRDVYLQLREIGDLIVLEATYEDEKDCCENLLIFDKNILEVSKCRCVNKYLGFEFSKDDKIVIN